MGLATWGPIVSDRIGRRSQNRGRRIRLQPCRNMSLYLGAVSHGKPHSLVLRTWLLCKTGCDYFGCGSVRLRLRGSASWGVCDWRSRSCSSTYMLQPTNKLVGGVACRQPAHSNPTDVIRCDSVFCDSAQAVRKCVERLWLVQQDFFKHVSGRPSPHPVLFSYQHMFKGIKVRVVFSFL